MRQTSTILLILLLAGLVLVQNQSPPATGQSDAHLIPITPPANWERIISTVPEPIPVELTPLPGPPDILTPSSVGADSCGGAVALPYQYGITEEVGDQTGVASFSIDSEDPSLLGCFARPTTNSTGYRSAWYRFDNFTTLAGTIVPQDGSGVKGRLVVTTEPNIDYRQNYDTIIAIYAAANDCTALTRLTCNDDSYALFSRASAPIVDGGRYYIQVVDFNAAVSGPATVNLVARVFPEGEWQSEPSLPQPTSRHTVVMDGEQAYIIGGQTFLQGVARRTGRTYRYDTISRTLVELATHQAGLTAAGEGYSNNDAVLIGDKIHLPTGDTGASNTYDGTHWVYNIPTNSWEVYSASNGQVDPPWGPPPGTNAPGFTDVVPFALGNQQGLYVIGGLTGEFFAADAESSSRTYRYVDGTPGFWQTLASMETPRYAHTAVVLGNDRVCVVGGLTDGPSLITNGECYFPTGSPPNWQPSVGDLNVPRYLAGSAVAGDGRWYVFGGYDASSNPVEEIEVFDPATGEWNVLGQNYHVTSPRPGWVRGGFVGSRLWLFGGEQAVNIPFSLVQSNPLPVSLPASNRLLLPLVAVSQPLGETFITAVPLLLGQPIHNNFKEAGDVYHTYRFDLGQTTTVLATLDHIRFGSNYDMLIYNHNKQLIGLGQNLGANPEQVLMTLPAGRYYIMVVRDAPPPAVQPDTSNYRLLVTQP